MRHFRSIGLVIVLALLASCSEGPSRSFTWLDGNQYRWLNEPSLCADDGSAVFFQKANEEGEFPPPRNLTEAKCARAQP